MSFKRFKQLIKPVVKPPIDALHLVLRQRQLRKRLIHVTQDSLQADLDQLELPTGAIVMVHSSLKSIGFVEGGASAVVGALEHVIVTRRGGTLALPTFSIDGTMRNTLASGRVFDVRSTPSNLGAIPEVFRQQTGVGRSVHPTHSVAALGPAADWLIADHHRAGTSFGTDTPMARMLERDGYLMGLGTHLGTVTFYHCVEDLVPDFPLKVYSDDSPFRTRCVDWEGQEHALQISAHSPMLAPRRIDRPENHALRDYFTRRFERAADLKWFDFGQSKGWVIRLQAMFDECRAMLDEGITIYTPLLNDGM